MYIKNVKINAYICIMYILVWPHNGVKSFLEEHSYFSASVFFIPFDVLTVSAESAQMYVLLVLCATPILVLGSVIGLLSLRNWVFL